ncbi:unnamed protein product, partial [Gongylonema pulchrum]|uniref:AAA_6 domain-containing protein n=1 Tax=Gongylonema pulchrum TaxID=637853 RepID=A0A183EQR1_9BILA
MTQPDRQLIAQVMLFSQDALLRDLIQDGCSLCKEQLSDQCHYDFGLRALKYVLVSAGNIKRDEIQRIIESRRDDVSGMVLVLQKSLVDHNEEVNEDDFSSELSEQQILIQSVCETLLYQITNLNHGLMLVGASGSGKTTAWKVLLKALERLEGVEGVAHVIDAKAMSKDSLYGVLDPNTREWTDGLFTHIIRKIIDNVRGETAKRQWVIFDGDVDPEWVENLNSVLDDNKLLTLPNGERLGIPPNVRIIFEVADLKYATLATVSRCGMVWFSEEM